MSIMSIASILKSMVNRGAGDDMKRKDEDVDQREQSGNMMEEHMDMDMERDVETEDGKERTQIEEEHKLPENTKNKVDAETRQEDTATIKRGSRKRKATDILVLSMDNDLNDRKAGTIKKKKNTVRIKVGSVGVTSRKKRETKNDWEVKDIVGHTIENGVLKYKVSWKGRGYKRSFQRVENLSCPDLLEEYHKKIGFDSQKELKENDDKNWCVKSILKHKIIDGILHYKIEWKGDYKPSYQPVGNLDCEALLNKYHRKIMYDPRKGTQYATSKK